MQARSLWFKIAPHNVKRMGGDDGQMGVDSQVRDCQFSGQLGTN